MNTTMMFALAAVSKCGAIFTHGAPAAVIDSVADLEGAWREVLLPQIGAFGVFIDAGLLVLPCRDSSSQSGIPPLHAEFSFMHYRNRIVYKCPQ